MPNDEDEIVRLDKVQYVLRSILGCNVLAPISPRATNILDVGTGSGRSIKCLCLRVGRWAIEVADQFPSARVIGMDLSPIQPTTVPINCEFMVGDLTEELDEFNDASMDLVHSRYVQLITTCGNEPELLGRG